jgi:hypothetical protein
MRLMQAPTSAALMLPLPLRVTDAGPIDSAVRRLRVVFDPELNANRLLPPCHSRHKREVNPG